MLAGLPRPAAQHSKVFQHESSWKALFQGHSAWPILVGDLGLTLRCLTLQQANIADWKPTRDFQSEIYTSIFIRWSIAILDYQRVNLALNFHRIKWYKVLRGYQKTTLLCLTELQELTMLWSWPQLVLQPQTHCSSSARFLFGDERVHFRALGMDFVTSCRSKEAKHHNWSKCEIGDGVLSIFIQPN